MRSTEQINQIKRFESDPFQVHSIITQSDVDKLLDTFENSEKIVKATGPVVAEIDHGDPILTKILTQLTSVLGNFDIRYAHFFSVERPHVLHIDDDFDYPNSYKAITVPLWHNGLSDPKFFVFNQHYYSGPAKFFKDREIDPDVHYNAPVTDYSNIDGLDETGIPNFLREQIDHLKDPWLDGLSIKAYFPWTITSAIVFDSLQIHSAGNFAKQGVTKKIGLSIFTKDPK